MFYRLDYFPQVLIRHLQMVITQIIAPIEMFPVIEVV